MHAGPALGWRSLLVAAALLTPPLPAPAAERPDFAPDRPGFADGSTVVGRGAFQVEAGLEWDHGPGERSWAVPALLRFGLDDRWELRLGTNGWCRWHGAEPGEPAEEGLTPVAVGAKVHLREGGRGLGHPSLGISLLLSPPSGSGALGTDRLTGEAKLAAEFDLGREFYLTANAGAGVYDDGEETFAAAVYALNVTHQVSDRVAFFVDLGGWSREASGGGSAAAFHYGVTWLLGRSSQIDVSPGVGLWGETMPDHSWSVGWSRRF